MELLVPASGSPEYWIMLGREAGLIAQTCQTFILKNCLTWRRDTVSSCASPFRVNMSDCSSEPWSSHLLPHLPAVAGNIFWAWGHSPMKPRARVKFRKSNTGTALHLLCSPYSAFANCLNRILLALFSLQFMMQFKVTYCTQLSWPLSSEEVVSNESLSFMTVVL